MKQVSVRYFHQNMYDLIKELPVMVIKKKSRYDQGEPYFIVTKPQEDFLKNLLKNEDDNNS